jgi:hypothetical protein
MIPASLAPNSTPAPRATAVAAIPSDPACFIHSRLPVFTADILPQPGGLGAATVRPETPGVRIGLPAGVAQATRLLAAKTYPASAVTCGPVVQERTARRHHPVPGGSPDCRHRSR